MAQALTAHEAVPHVVEAPTASAAQVVAPSARSARAVYEEIIGEAALKWDMPPERHLATEAFGLDDVVGALQKKLSWLAARSDLDAWAIALIFRDVAVYLDVARPVREEVLDCVLQAVPDSGEVVLVSHSLGTVVALDLATRLSPGVSAVRLATAGSPLGLDSVYSRLLVGGPKRPDVVADWSNVWCPNDAVAIGCPLADDWADRLADLAVINAGGRAHSSVEYLSHTEAARPIGSHLAH